MVVRQGPVLLGEIPGRGSMLPPGDFPFPASNMQHFVTREHWGVGWCNLFEQLRRGELLWCKLTLYLSFNEFDTHRPSELRALAGLLEEDQEVGAPSWCVGLLAGGVWFIGVFWDSGEAWPEHWLGHSLNHSRVQTGGMAWYCPSLVLLSPSCCGDQWLPSRFGVYWGCSASGQFCCWWACVSDSLS